MRFVSAVISVAKVCLKLVVDEVWDVCYGGGVDVGAMLTIGSTGLEAGIVLGCLMRGCCCSAATLLAVLGDRRKESRREIKNVWCSVH